MTKEKVLMCALKGLIKRLENTEKFIIEQAPDICKEIIEKVYIKVYASFLFNLIMLIGSLLGLLVSIYYSITLSWIFENVGLNIGRGLGVLIFGIAFCGISYETLETICRLLILRRCPKLTLIRELKKLVK